MNLKKSGRPQKTVIDILKTLVWFEYVAVQVFQTYQKRNVTPSHSEKKSNKASLKSLEVFFDQEDSNIWYKYSIGSNSPNSESLALVDNKIPCSSIYFNHPIWNFLKALPTGKLDLRFFYSQLSENSRQLLESNEVTCLFNFTYTDGNDFSKFENLLEFYSCIIYRYYQAKFKIDPKEVEKIYFYFSRNTNHILNQFGTIGYFLLKLMRLHLLQPEDSVSSSFTIESNLNQQQTLSRILKEINLNPKRYQLLTEKFDTFRLDGDSYKNPNTYIFLEDDISYP